MAEIVSKNHPPKNTDQTPCPESLDLDQSITSQGPRFFNSFSDALRALPDISPRGSIVVLLGVPDNDREKTLEGFNREIINGKRIWSVKNALRDVVNHSGDPYPEAEKFIINGYIPLRLGTHGEIVFQMNVSVKCKQSPAFVLTNDWPDPTVLGQGSASSLCNSRWAKGFFTPGAEVLCIRYDEHTKVFELGRGALRSDSSGQRYSFSNLGEQPPAT